MSNNSLNMQPIRINKSMFWHYIIPKTQHCLFYIKREKEREIEKEREKEREINKNKCLNYHIQLDIGKDNSIY